MLAVKTKPKTKFWRGLNKFKRVTHISQLSEGMVLIDKHLCKRNILHISETHIWLSHKYGKKSKATGKIWPIDTFIKNFPNWIFKEYN